MASEELTEDEAIISAFDTLLKDKVNSYLGEDKIANDGLLTMLCDMAVEKFQAIRCYPPYYTVEQIYRDMTKRSSIIAYAVVEVYSKRGAEGQTSHSENGTSRSYRSLFTDSFRDIAPLASVLKRSSSASL